jgi:hypothetical protein
MPEQSNPQPVTQRIRNHPWHAVAVCAALMTAWMLVLSGGAVLVPLGLLMFVFFGTSRPDGGPRSRWRQWILRKFPKDPPRHT